MASHTSLTFEGGCACRKIRYRMETKPLIINCCHCRWCQRETGSAFVINAVIESSYVTQLSASPVLVTTPSESGNGQVIARCPECYVAIWSHYSAGPVVSFVRIGTLDRPDALEPDVHIYMDSKLPWVQLPEGAKIFSQYYEMEQVWPKESMARRRAYLPELEKWRAAKKAAAST